MEQKPTRREILELLFSKWTPPPLKTETVPLAEAAGRVFAGESVSRDPIPPVRASAMDGIAVRSADFSAGMPDTSKWTLGEDYVRADTGDDFDDRFDAVIPIEDVMFEPGGGLRLNMEKPFRAGQNVRPSGSTLPRGAALAEKGLPLRGQDLAALAAGGYAEAEVVSKPRVAFQPTGSELIAPGVPLERGQNYDCNSVLADYMLREMGAEPLCWPIIPDDPAAIRAALERGLREADAVVLNGGSSKGDEDFNTRLLAERGELLPTARRRDRAVPSGSR